MHIAAAMEIIKTARAEDPTLFTPKMEQDVIEMMKESIECEMAFAEDLLGQGIAGLSANGMRQYLQCVADQRLANLGIKPVYGSKNPFNFMELQDVQELANFFERRVSAYQTGVTGAVAFSEEF